MDLSFNSILNYFFRYVNVGFLTKKLPHAHKTTSKYVSLSFFVGQKEYKGRIKFSITLNKKF